MQFVLWHEECAWRSLTSCLTELEDNLIEITKLLWNYSVLFFANLEVMIIRKWSKIGLNEQIKNTAYYSHMAGRYSCQWHIKIFLWNIKVKKSFYWGLWKKFRLQKVSYWTKKYWILRYKYDNESKTIKTRLLEKNLHCIIGWDGLFVHSSAWNLVQHYLNINGYFICQRIDSLAI